MIAKLFRSAFSASILWILSSAVSTPAWASHYFRAEYKILIQLGKLKEKTQDIGETKFEVDFSDSTAECQALVHGKNLPCTGGPTARSGWLFGETQMIALIHEVTGSSRYTKDSKFSSWVNLPQIRFHGDQPGDVHLVNPNPKLFFTVCDGAEREAYYVTIQQVGWATKLR